MAVLFEAPHPRGLAASDAFTIELKLPGKTVFPAGHETITRRAAGPLVAAGRLTPGDVAALVAGVRSVDENLAGLVLPSLQRQHFLRATLCQPVRQAYREAIARLYDRFEAAVTAPGSAALPPRRRGAAPAPGLVLGRAHRAHRAHRRDPFHPLLRRARQTRARPSTSSSATSAI